MKRVSVFVPCYNVEKYVRKMLDSVLCQTFTDFDLVLVDDGSTDGTYDILKEYEKKDDRIKLYNNEKNMGLPYTRNLMFEYCDSDYIALMDADDLMPVYRLKEETEYLDHHPDVAAVGGAMQVIDEWGNYTDRVSFVPQDYEACKAAMLMADCFPNGSMMIRRSDVSNSGVRYDMRFNCMQDYRFWSELIIKCKMANLNHIMLYYRENNTSVTARNRLNKKKGDLYDIIHSDYVDALFPDDMSGKEMAEYLELSRMTSSGSQPVKWLKKYRYSYRMQMLLSRFKSYYKRKNEKDDLFISQIDNMIRMYTSNKLYMITRLFIKLVVH